MRKKSINNISRKNSAFDNEEEVERQTIPINFSTNNNDSPLNKSVRYANSKSSPIYNYYNNSFQYFSQFFTGDFNNQRLIQKNSYFNNNHDILKLQRLGLI